MPDTMRTSLINTKRYQQATLKQKQQMVLQRIKKLKVKMLMLEQEVNELRMLYLDLGKAVLQEMDRTGELDKVAVGVKGAEEDDEEE